MYLSGNDNSDIFEGREAASPGGLLIRAIYLKAVMDSLEDWHQPTVTSKKPMKFNIKFILSKFCCTFKNSNNTSKKNLKHDHWRL